MLHRCVWLLIIGLFSLQHNGMNHLKNVTAEVSMRFGI